MKTVLLIVAVSLCVLSAGASAGGPAREVPAEDSAKTAARPAEAPEASLKVFIHPETGEILTLEQRRALGGENGRAEAEDGEAAAVRASDIPGPEETPNALQGRRVDLENGDYVIVIDDPDSKKVETKVRFDDEGKARIRCSH